MSKPYSQVGLPGEWRTLLHAYAFGACVVIAMIFIAGFSCGRRKGAAEGEQLRKELAAAATNSTKAYAAVLNERAETDAENRRLRDSLATLPKVKAAAERASRRADSLAAAAHVGEVPTVPLPVFLAMRASRDSLQLYVVALEARLSQASTIVLTRIPAERAASDTLDHLRVVQVGIADSVIATTKPPRCGAKCGGVIAIGVLVAGRIAWSALASVLGAHP